MDGFLSIAGGFVGVAVGGFLGFIVGERVVKGRSWMYWTANLIGGVVAVAGASVGLVTDSSFLWIGGLALLGAWITGLKYGYAKNPGVRAMRAAKAARNRV